MFFLDYALIQMAYYDLAFFKFITIYGNYQSLNGKHC